MCPGFRVDLPPRVLGSVGEGTSLAAVHPDCHEFRLLQEPPFAPLCSGVLWLWRKEQESSPVCVLGVIVKPLAVFTFS